MRINIHESAITNFSEIYHLAENKSKFLGNLVNFSGSLAEIVEDFQKQSLKRPLIKKAGIYVKIIFPNINIHEQEYKKILTNYILEIGWDDLQYIAFLKREPNEMEFHFIFNRVTLEGKALHLRCLGATRRQYEILEKSQVNFIQMKSNKQMKKNSEVRIQESKLMSGGFSAKCGLGVSPRGATL